MIDLIRFQDSLDNRVRCRGNESGAERGIKKHIQEVLVIVKAHTVRNPGTVMVHLKHTLITLGAMMAPIRLFIKKLLTFL